MSTRTPAQAIAVIQASIKAHTNIGTGACQKNAHDIYGIGSGYGSALIAWQNAKYKHTDLSTAPVGAFIYMDGGHTLVQGQPAGHVVIKADENGQVFTPGGPADTQHWYLTTLADLERAWPWHHTLGWTEDINGVRVPGLDPIVKAPDGKVPAPAVKPTPKPPVVVHAPAATPNIDAAVVATRKAIRNGPDKRKASLRGALAILKKWSAKY